MQKVRWVEQLGQVVEAIEKGEVKFKCSKAKKIEEYMMEEQRVKKFGNDDERKIVQNQIRSLIHEAGEELLKFARIDLDKSMNCLFHQDRTPSFVYYKDSKRWHCFGCDEHKDIIDVLSKIWGITNANFNVKRERVLRLLGVNIPPVTKRHDERLVKAKGSNQYDKYEYYKPVETDEEALEFLSLRGINKAMINKYSIRVWSYGTEKCVCLKSGQNYWIRRKIRFKSEAEKYWNKKGVAVELFNTKVLNGEGIVFVVESAFDVIILDQMGYKAIALNSVSNAKVLGKYIAQHPENKNHFIILMDNDTSGNKCAQEIEMIMLMQLYNSVVVHHYIHHYIEWEDMRVFLNGFKDVGEAYVANKDKTQQAIDVIYCKAKQMIEPRPIPNTSDNSNEMTMEYRLGGFTRSLSQKDDEIN